MKREVRLFLLALQFLTRVPIPAWVGFEEGALAASLRYFPLVGVGVGAFAALLLGVSNWLWSSSVAAVVSTLGTVWLTGAFHEDGLADTCDALGGAVGRERALEIMKDSRIGTYGAAGLMLSLFLKISILSGLLLLAWPLALVATWWCHAASRAAPVWVITRLAYGGDLEHAKAKPLAMQAGRSELWPAVASTILFSVVAWALVRQIGYVVLPALLGALIAGAAVTMRCASTWQRRLGGFTGDTLGATQQLVELTGLLAWFAVARVSTSYLQLPP